MAADPLARRRALLLLLASPSGLAAIRAAAARGGAGPLYLSPRDDAAGRHWISAIDDEGRLGLDLRLPARGHGMALHPTRPWGFVFGRRPGRMALLFDHAAGTALRRIDATPGRFLCGHGCFSADGRLLLTTEGEEVTCRGVIAIRDVEDGFRHLGELSTFGTGPHQMLPLAGTGLLATANGGLIEGPGGDRDVLNLAEMRSSVTLVEAASGRLVAELALDERARLASLRHLDATTDGRIAVALQHQAGGDPAMPLLLLGDGAGLAPLPVPEALRPRIHGYIGSILFDATGRHLAASAPKGGLILLLDAKERRLIGTVDLPDGCGLAARPEGGFLATGGQGHLATIEIGIDGPRVRRRFVEDARFDNHALTLAG